MPPLWVLIVAPVGVLSIVLLTWLLGGRFDGPVTREWVVRFLLTEEPPLTVLDAFISADGRSALVLLEGSRLGVVSRVGDGLAFRYMADAIDVVTSENAVRVRFPGVTFPAVTVRRSDQAIPASIEQALDALEV